VLLLMFCLAWGRVAARDAGADPSLVVAHHVRHVVVEPDGTYLLTVDDERTLAGPRRARDDVRFTLRASRTLDAIVSVQAYTQKPDGRRLPVLPGGIQSRDAGAALATTIAFPGAAPGDRLIVHYVVRRHTPRLPGQFDDVAVMPPLVNRDTTLIYDMPPSMPLHADAVGFVPEPADSPPGRRRYRWRYVDGPNARPEADAVSVLDYGRRLVVSTLPDYPALAAAWRIAAAAKATPPSPADAALARRLTAGLPDTNSRVLALAEWVRNHVPRGDGEDGATRLDALLAAIGVGGTPALVNGGNAYKLPDAPALGVLDHVIEYVPDLDLFVDPAAAVNAGDLPTALLGKPVLLLKRGTFAMTPVLQPQQTRMTATIAVAHLRTNGSVATTWHARSAVDAAVDKLMRERARRLDFVCAAVDAEDETRLRLPQGMRVAALPGPASVISGGLFYRASYSLENDALLVRRRLTFRHGRATCTPADAVAMRPALERIRRDLRSRVVVAGSGALP
jgi:hypothetical protein